MKEKTIAIALVSIVVLSSISLIVIGADPADGEWVEDPSMPINVKHHASAELNGYAYSIAGLDGGGNVISSTYRYDPKNETWTQVGSYSTGVHHLAAASLDGKIYATGGYNDVGDIKSWVEIYYPSNQTWVYHHKMPVSRARHAMVSFNGYLYVIGGEDSSSSARNEVYRYNPDSDSWTQMNNIPYNAERLTATVFDGHIYIFGGTNGNGDIDKISKYYPSNDTWIEVGTTHRAAWGMKSFSGNGKLFYHGGKKSGGSVNTKLYQFYPSNNSIVQRNSSNYRHAQHGGAVINGSFYAFGGFRDDATQDPIKIVEEYNILGTSTTTYTLSGYVNDTNGKPVENANVNITDGLGNVINSSKTNANGYYEVSAVDGKYTVIANKKGYYKNESVINLTSDKRYDWVLEKEPKTVKLVFHVTDWLNYSDSSKYKVYLENTDTGKSEPVTDNATVTVENTTLFTIDSANNTVIATNNTNIFGVSNITANYTTDAGTNLSVTKTIAVSPISIEYIFNQDLADETQENATGGLGGGKGGVLPPLYAFFAVLKNIEIQYILLSIVAGIGVTYVSNAYGGISGVIFLLIAGWLMEFVSLGIVLGGLFTGMFIILNSELGLYKTDNF